MLKGLALTPPAIGRISIGRIVERQGRRLPEKDDEFTLTSQVQNAEGWVPHPLNEALRGPANADGARPKLRSLPVRLLFDAPELNLRASYCKFDRQTGRPLCVGNGETCRRVTLSGMQTLECPAPEACPLAADGSCKPYGRLNVRLSEDDELGSFVFRTTGFNSIRTLSTRLSYFYAASGGVLSTLALSLRLRGKSTTQSHRTPIYYVDLTLPAGVTLSGAVSQARADWDARRASGVEQAALDAAARVGLECGAFEESDEDAPAVIEEFYPEPAEAGSDALRSSARPQAPASLAQRLDAMASSRSPGGQERMDGTSAGENGVEGAAPLAAAQPPVPATESTVGTAEAATGTYRKVRRSPARLEAPAASAAPSTKPQ